MPKISSLLTASPLSGAELIPIVQSGETVRTSLSTVNTYLSSTYLQIPTRLSTSSILLGSELLSISQGGNSVRTSLSTVNTYLSSTYLQIPTRLSTSATLSGGELFSISQGGNTVRTSLSAVAQNVLQANAPLYLTSVPINGVTNAFDGQIVRVSVVSGVGPFTDYICRRSGGVATATFTKIVNQDNVLGSIGGEAAEPSKIGAEFLPENIEITSIQLSDTGEVALPSGSLGLNSNGNMVIHDDISNGDVLPEFVTSNTISRFGVTKGSSMMVNMNLIAPLCKIYLNENEAQNGNFLYITSEISLLCPSTTPNLKPDVYFYIYPSEVEDPLSFEEPGWMFLIATADENYTKKVRTFDATFSITNNGNTGQPWQLNLTAQTGSLPNSFYRTITRTGTYVDGCDINDSAYQNIGNITGIDNVPRSLNVALALLSDGNTDLDTNLFCTGTFGFIVKPLS
jgi:hypothetical protein